MSAGMQIRVLLVWPAAPTRSSFCWPSFPCFLSNARRADTPSQCSSGHHRKGLQGFFWVRSSSSPCLTGAAVGSVLGDQADPVPGRGEQPFRAGSGFAHPCASVSSSPSECRYSLGVAAFGWCFAPSPAAHCTRLLRRGKPCTGWWSNACDSSWGLYSSQEPGLPQPSAPQVPLVLLLQSLSHAEMS